MPVFLVGADVNGIVDFTTVAHVGIFNVGAVNYIMVGLNRAHHINKGIKENKEFSMCLPTEAMMVSVDYCGIVSGAKANKSGIFKVARGKLAHAPMAEECPVCMECRLHDILDYKTHEVFVGAIVATHAEEEILTDGSVDISKVRPMLFDMPSRSYWKLGERAGAAWSEGKKHR
jgi:flavin reductase (DIM6/NTAB) family NADH-FMN oxidoreductase RutF